MGIFKFDAIYFFIKKYESISITFKISFMTKVNSNNGNELKSDIFYGAYPNLTLFFIGR